MAQAGNALQAAGFLARLGGKTARIGITSFFFCLIYDFLSVISGSFVSSAFMSMGQVALRGIFTAAVAQWTHVPELLNNLATSLAALSQEIPLNLTDVRISP